MRVRLTMGRRTPSSIHRANGSSSRSMNSATLHCGYSSWAGRSGVQPSRFPGRSTPRDGEILAARGHRGARRCPTLRGDAALLLLVQLPDVVLRVELHAELRDEVELRLEEIDVVLLVRHQFFEHVARHVVL